MSPHHQTFADTALEQLYAAMEQAGTNTIWAFLDKFAAFQ
jgi:hypothetical protein